MQDNSSVAVVVADRPTMMREGIAALIDAAPDLTLVAQGDGPTAFKEVEAAPDVVVTEIDLDEVQGPEVIERLRGVFPESRILVLTTVSHPAKIEAALGAGADGYVLKTSGWTELLSGIRAVARGETYLQPSVGVALARWHAPHRSPTQLTPREEQVLGLVAAGHTNGEVAQLIGVSMRTVETHRGRIVQKLGIRTRAGLVEYAQAVGLAWRDVQ